MSKKQWMGVISTITALILPHPALAGMVSVSPLASPAPALSGPVLIGLAVLLAGIGFVALRHRSIGAATAVVATLLLSGIGHAGFNLFVISGDECNRVTIKQYPTNQFLHLVSACPNPIRILALDPQCMGAVEGGGAAIVPYCQVGDVLGTSQECELPSCL